MRRVIDPYIRDSMGNAIRKKSILDIEVEKQSLQASEPTRMATEKLDAGMLDNVIDDQIRKEARAVLGDNVSDETVEAIVDATMEELEEGDPRFQRETLNALAEMNKRLVKAGILIEDLGGGTGGLHSLAHIVGELKGNVPGPYLSVNSRGNELRTHLNYETVPGTNVQGIVPYMDPANPNSVLQTELGQLRVVGSGRNSTVKTNNGQSFESPSEYIGSQALKLAGRPVEVGNTDVITKTRRDGSRYKDTAFHRSDMNDPTDLLKGRIDIERGHSVYDRHTLPLQLTARWKPDGFSVQDGDAAVLDSLNNIGRRDVVDVVRHLEQDGLHKINEKGLYGKAMKTKVSNPKDRMHQVLSLEYAPGSRKIEDQGIAVGPKSVHMIDLANGLAVAQDHGRNVTRSRNLRPGQINISAKPEGTGAGGKSDPRIKLKVNMPKGLQAKRDRPELGVKKGDAWSSDYSQDNPLVNQLLDVLPYL